MVAALPLVISKEVLQQGICFGVMETCASYTTEYHILCVKFCLQAHVYFRSSMCNFCCTCPTLVNIPLILSKN